MYRNIVSPSSSASLGGRPQSAALSCACTHSGLDIAWIDLGGSLDLTTAPQLAERLRQPELQALLVVLDLRDLTFLDSSGLHTIMGAASEARETGRRLFLLRGQPNVDLLFKLVDYEVDFDIGDVEPSGPTPAGLHSDRWELTG